MISHLLKEDVLLLFNYRNSSAAQITGEIMVVVMNDCPSCERSGDLK